MVKRRTRNLLAPLLIGAIALVVPGLAGARDPAGPKVKVSEAGDGPLSAARRKPRVPTSTLPFAPEPDIEIPPVVEPPPAVPAAPAAPPAPAPAPPPTPPTTEAPPVVRPIVSPGPPPPPVQPIRVPAERLPTTGLAAAFAAVAGALLSLGGFCVAAGRGRRTSAQVAASAQRTP